MYNIPQDIELQVTHMAELQAAGQNAPKIEAPAAPVKVKNKVFTKKNMVSLAIAVFVVVLVLRLFVFETFFVQGDSMSPTILSGEFVFVNKLAYLRSEPKRGDIIVAIPRVFPGRVIKRVIGLPGEWFSIENEHIVIRNSRTDEGVNLDEAYLKLPN